jgi:ATP-binding cassette subfamily B protein
MGADSTPRSGGRLIRLRRAMLFAFPYRHAVGGLFAITVILATINAGEPLVLKYVFDDLGVHRNLHTLFVGIAALAVLGALREIGSAASNWLTLNNII